VDAEIVPLRTEHAAAFATLNRAWLDAYALYEPADEPQLTDPEGAIGERGGTVLVALRGDVVVGTAALAPHGPHELELVKLSVAEHARGSGLGRRLVEACIARAREAGARRLLLVSSSRLASALRLYESLGFAHRPLPAWVPYATADVYMELELDATLARRTCA
jgi:putative acetyltransferase